MKPQTPPHLSTPKRRLFDLTRQFSNFIFGPELLHRSKIAYALYRITREAYEGINPSHRAWRAFTRQNPDAPWFSQDSIPFIKSFLRPGLEAFEWGAGRSTIWLARQGVRVVSIEGRKSWAEHVRQKLTSEGLDGLVQICLIEIPVEHNVPAKLVSEYAAAIESFPTNAFDLVIVDGHFRSACLSSIGNRIKPCGLLVVDNADTAEISPRLAQLKDALIGGFDNGIWQTNVYRIPSDGLPSFA